MKPIIYLAGAIRDDNVEDIVWRERMVDTLSASCVVLNPLGAKHYHKNTKTWTLAGRLSAAPTIFKHDLAHIKRCDILVANLNGLGELSASGKPYANIGTLMELGAAAVLHKLIYLIPSPNAYGSANSMFYLHPFLEQATAITFPGVDDVISFLLRYAHVWSGHDAHMDY